MKHSTKDKRSSLSKYSVLKWRFLKQGNLPVAKCCPHQLLLGGAIARQVLTQIPRLPSASASALHQQTFPERWPRYWADLASLVVCPVPSTWEIQEFYFGGQEDELVWNAGSSALPYKATLEPEAKGKLCTPYILSKMSSHVFDTVRKVNEVPQSKHETLKAPHCPVCLHTTVNLHKWLSPLHSNVELEKKQQIVLFKVVIPCWS